MLSAQDEVVRGRAVALLRENPYGVLATVSGDGETHARLVQHLVVEDDGTIWIGASPRSRKAIDVANHPQVAYTVEARPRFAYATVEGAARLVDEEVTRSRCWDEGLRAFFPGGPDGDDFVLVRISPSRIEVMDFTSGIHPDPYGLAPAVVLL